MAVSIWSTKMQIVPLDKFHVKNDVVFCVEEDVGTDVRNEVVSYVMSNVVFEIVLYDFYR